MYIIIFGFYCYRFFLFDEKINIAWTTSLSYCWNSINQLFVTFKSSLHSILIVSNGSSNEYYSLVSELKCSNLCKISIVLNLNWLILLSFYTKRHFKEVNDVKQWYALFEMQKCGKFRFTRAHTVHESMENVGGCLWYANLFKLNNFESIFWTFRLKSFANDDDTSA